MPSLEKRDVLASTLNTKSTMAFDLVPFDIQYPEVRIITENNVSCISVTQINEEGQSYLGTEDPSLTKITLLQSMC